MQQEPGHGVGLVGVQVLGHRQEPDAQRDQFLDGADAVGHAAAPAVQLPHQHGVDAPGARILQEPVELRPAGPGSTPARIYVFSKDLPEGLAA